jgi:hypothetical protein
MQGIAARIIARGAIDLTVSRDIRLTCHKGQAEAHCSGQMGAKGGESALQFEPIGDRGKSWASGVEGDELLQIQVIVWTASESEALVAFRSSSTSTR